MHWTITAGAVIVIYLMVILTQSSSSTAAPAKKASVDRKPASSKNAPKNAPPKKEKAEAKNRSRSRSKSPAPPPKRAPSPKSTPPKRNTRGTKTKKSAQEDGPWSDYNPAVQGSVVKNGVKKSTRKNKGKNPSYE